MNLQSHFSRKYPQALYNNFLQALNRLPAGRLTRPPARSEHPIGSLRRLHSLRPLTAFLITSGLLTLTALLVAGWHVHVDGWTVGLNPLFIDGWRADYMAYVPRMRYLHSPHFYDFCEYWYPWYYPPAAIFIHLPFFYISIHIMWTYTAYATLSLVVFAGLLWVVFRKLANLGLSKPWAFCFVFISFATAWPLYFSIQRGNFESLIWPLSALGVWLFCRKSYSGSSILIGIAGAIKLYPLLLLFLFFSERRYKNILAGLGAFAILNLLAARFIEPSILDSMRQSVMAVTAWTIRYTLHATAREPGYDHSLFCLLKVLIRPKESRLLLMLQSYFLIASITFGVVFFKKVIHQPVLNQALFLTCCMTILPPTSFEYALLSLYIPWAWLVVQTFSYESAPKYLTLLMVLFAIIFAPLTFFLSHGIPVLTPGKSICIMLLAVIAVVEPLDRHASVAETIAETPMIANI